MVIVRFFDRIGNEITAHSYSASFRISKRGDNVCLNNKRYKIFDVMLEPSTKDIREISYTVEEDF